MRLLNCSLNYSLNYSNLRQLAYLSTVTVIVAISGCSVIEKPIDIVKQVLENKPVTTPTGGSTATTVDEYKRERGKRIQEVNSTKVYVGRPQALLRAVIVVDFVVDSQGGLVRSEFMRSNHDTVAEATAMATLRNTAPFPKPPPALLKGGRLELSESWLFDTDGKFQIRSVAMQQMDH